MKLYLDIFIFQLQKKSKSKKDKQPINFDEIYGTLAQKYPNKNHILAFFQEMVQSFDKTFYLDKENTRALCFQNLEKFTISSERNTISGQFIGGNTGLQFNVYKNDNATEITHTVDPSEVTSLPFYFKIWLPKSFNTGVLIVQRYSTSTCLGLFKKLMEDFFSTFGYKLKFSKFMPQEKRNEFLEICNISEIDISWKDNIDNALKPKLNLMTTGKMVAVINGICVPLRKFVGDLAYRQKVIDDISQMYPAYDEKVHKLKFFYIDEKGQRASSTLEDINNIIPSINLGKKCVNPNDTPNWEEIENQATIFLELIKTNIKYSVNEL